MKNDAQRAPFTPMNRADAVSHHHPVIAASAGHGTLRHSDDGRVTLVQGDNPWSRLSAWALFREHDFAAVEVLARSAQQHDHLQRKRLLAV